jgi:hypothetical protein
MATSREKGKPKQQMKSVLATKNHMRGEQSLCRWRILHKVDAFGDVPLETARASFQQLLLVVVGRLERVMGLDCTVRLFNRVVISKKTCVIFSAFLVRRECFLPRAQ